VNAVFDTYVVVDWSAAAVPKTGPDSIWAARLADGELALENPPTRREAEALLGEWLGADLARGRRILAGFDFPFFYPRGFASRLALDGTPWRAVWDLIDGLIDDDDRNANNRFRAAAALNRRISGSAFPFWACPRGEVCDTLEMKHHRRHDTDGLPEKRLVEDRVRGPQPTWKLAGTGAAGGQALTGIPVVRRLRDRFADAALVWPCETGLRAPTLGSCVVLAEVYPSLVVPDPAPVKDAGQVSALARHFAELDRDGTLGPLFAADPDLTPEQRIIVEREEGWVLGVVKDARRPRVPRLQ
jgi:hypothetical protein